MQIGLFFGSFNPIHTGHLIIAQHLAEHTDLDQVWLVVSPQNPLKDKASLAKDQDRLHLVQLAIEYHPKLRVSNIEFGLPKPSYTVNTLAHLKEKFPQHEFSIIMGGDNLAHFHKWKNYKFILEHYKIYVYKRGGDELNLELATHPNIVFCEAPLLGISSTYIRNLIQKKKSIRYLVPDEVWKYIESGGLYKKSKPGIH